MIDIIRKFLIKNRGRRKLDIGNGVAGNRSAPAQQIGSLQINSLTVVQVADIAVQIDVACMNTLMGRDHKVDELGCRRPDTEGEVGGGLNGILIGYI